MEALGIPAVILFGLPEKKDERGSEASSPQGAVQRAIEAIRKAKLELLVITDVCLCEYTSHGHCGVVERRGMSERSDAGAAGRGGAFPCAGRRGHCGAVGHDGRARGRDPARAG